MSIFKAYDIRGLYPGELNEKTAFAIGLAVSELFRPEVVAVGTMRGRPVSQSPRR